MENKDEYGLNLNPTEATGEPVLPAQSAHTSQPKIAPPRGSARKFVLISIGAIVVVLVVILALPATRYGILGSFMTRRYSVQVLSSAGSVPLAGAKITIGTRTAYSDRFGKASFQVPVGHIKVTVSKKYFAFASRSILVGLSGPSRSKIVLRVTGIIVPVEITNKLGGEPIPGAVISTEKSSAQSSPIGRAQIVLSAKLHTQSATVSAPGYISTQAQITVTSQLSLANLITMVPVGSVYYMSDVTGTLNVMSSNLDGSDSKVVLAGTGKELTGTPQLYVSDDSKYLALLAIRDGNQAHLYVFEGSNPYPVEVNPKASSYSVVGWTSNDYLIFQIYNSSIPLWQSGGSDLISYNPATNISKILFASQASGVSNTDYVDQSIQDVGILANNKIYYQVSSYGGSQVLQANDSNTLNVVNSDGSASQTIFTTTTNNMYSPMTLVGPDSFVFNVYPQSASNTFYLYSNGEVTIANAETFSILNNSATSSSVYYPIDNGNKLLWSVYLNGHLSLLVGDMSQQNKVQIANLDSNFSVYGMSTNPNYLVVSKNQSELYSLPISGIDSQSALVQIGSYLNSNGGYPGCGQQPQSCNQ